MFAQERIERRPQGDGVFRSPDAPIGAGTTKYRVSGVNDPAETSAEQMADSVMGGGIFRDSEGVGDSGGMAELSASDLSGGGEMLPMGLQSSMEQSFGTSFSDVRVHTGEGADRASRSIAARAFTKGQDIYFRNDSYSPDTFEGQHLIAHELAHVAAGDEGLHRINGSSGGGGATGSAAVAAPSEEEKKRNECLDAMNSAKMKSRRTNTPLELILSESSNLEVLKSNLANPAAGSASKERFKDRNRLEGELNGNIAELEQKIDEYLAAEAAYSGKAEDEIKRSDDKYQQAARCLEDSKKLRDDLSGAKTNIDIAADMARVGTGAGESAAGQFSEPVLHMMDSPACSQFFKAVGDLKKGAAGADFAAQDSTTFNALGADHHLKANVVESGAAAHNRRNTVAGAAASAAGVGADIMGNATDLNSEYKYNEDLEGGGDKWNEHDQNAKQASGVMGVVAGAAQAATDTVDLATGSKMLHDKEQMRKDKLAFLANSSSEIGKLGTADHAGRLDMASKGTGVLGDISGAVSAGGGAFKYGNETANNVNTIADLTGSSLGLVGDTLGIASSSTKAEDQRRKDAMAKKSMRTLGEQLEKTLPGTSAAGGGAAPGAGGAGAAAAATDRVPKIKAVCDRLKQENFNSARHTGGNMEALITGAMVDDPAVTPTLEPKQKSLLGSILMLEKSRATAKKNAKDARGDVLMGLANFAVDIGKLVAAALKAAGQGVAGSIVGLVASVVGGVVGAKDMVEGFTESGAAKAQTEMNAERNKKLGAARQAIGMMAGLPELSLDTLRAARTQNLPIPEDRMMAAEQYAAVFNMLDAANVNMVDVLFAIEKGGFGTETGGTAKTLDASLKDMYNNLSFSNIEGEKKRPVA